MPFSSPWAILGGMKILASVAALVLVGLTGGWLWMDATAQAGQDTQGVVITGAVDPQAATSLVSGPAEGSPAESGSGGVDGSSSSARQESLDQVVSLLGSASEELATRADEARQAEARARAEAAEEAADEAADAAEEAEKRAEKQAEEERKAREDALKEEQKARERAAKDAADRRAEPIPVQPAPVSPGGSCEWDEDEWDCDHDWDDPDDR
jgi:hypothetical protein